MPGTVFNAGDIIGKTLIARYQLAVWDRTPDKSGVKIGVIKARNSCGVVDSWVTDASDGTIYWAFRTTSGKYYYIAHASGSFDVSALREQGVITTQEKIEEEKEKQAEWYEKVVKSIGKIAIPIAVVFAIASIMNKNSTRK